MLEVALNALKVPLDTEISPISKLLVASLEVNVSDKVASLELNPSAPSAAVMVMVGPVRS